MMKFIRKTYNWCINIASHPKASLMLGGLAFAESSFFPVPPDITLIPMCIARRDKAFMYATITTVASVVGGVFGYFIGMFLFETIGKSILGFYGLLDQFSHFKELYNNYGAWIVFAGGYTPIPYKVITIASGVAQMSLPSFIITSILGRAMRFYLEAFLLWKYGSPIQEFIEKYLGIITFVLMIALIGGFVALKYIF